MPRRLPKTFTAPPWLVTVLREARSRFPKRLAAVAPVAVLLCLGTTSASARTQTFRPVKVTRNALVFKPPAVAPGRVRSARLMLRDGSNGAIEKRHVRTRKVRRAAASRSKLRLRRPAGADGRLKVKVRRAVPAPSKPPKAWKRFASFESDLTSDTDGWNSSMYRVTRTSEHGGIHGDYAAKIDTSDPALKDDCSCPRVKFQGGDPFSLGEGDEVWFGGSWYVTDASDLAGARLMNLAHWADGGPGNWYLALLSPHDGPLAGKLLVVASRYYDWDNMTVLANLGRIPEDRWFSIDVHAKLSTTPGEALTEVYLDKDRLAATTKRNMANPGPLTFYNAGLSNLPYYWGLVSTVVYFDAPRLSW